MQRSYWLILCAALLAIVGLWLAGVFDGTPFPVENAREYEKYEKCFEPTATRLGTERFYHPREIRKQIEVCLKEQGYSLTATLKQIARTGFAEAEIECVMSFFAPASFAQKYNLPLNRVYSIRQSMYARAIHDYGEHKFSLYLLGADPRWDTPYSIGKWAVNYVKWKGQEAVQRWF